jgi:hypothetical protein
MVAVDPAALRLPGGCGAIEIARFGFWAGSMMPR